MSSVRLNGRFLKGLLEGAVPLSRGPVRQLWRTPEAFDAYVWARGRLHRGADEVGGLGWDDLQGRFGVPSRDAAIFRASFGRTLRSAAAADPTIAIAVGDTRVVVRPRERDASDFHPDEEDVSPGAPVMVPGTTHAPVPEAAGPVEVLDAGAATAEVDPHLRSDGSGDGPGAVPALAGPPRPAFPDPVSLSSRQTGVPGVIWLRHGGGQAFPLVGVTPGSRLDLGRLTVLAVEPMLLQVEGGLPEHDFAEVASWIMTNRDLIDDVWEGRVGSVEELDTKVQMVRAPTWR